MWSFLIFPTKNVARMDILLHIVMLEKVYLFKYLEHVVCLC